MGQSISCSIEAQATANVVISCITCLAVRAVKSSSEAHVLPSVHHHQPELKFRYFTLVRAQCRPACARPVAMLYDWVVQGSHVYNAGLRT